VPELPEVETTRRGIAGHVTGRRVTAVVVRDRRLRWPVSRRLDADLPGQRIASVERRAKYLLLRCEAGTVLLHLGMSGSLRIVPAASPPRPHDHVDLCLDDGSCLRLHDPRRFSSLHWTTADPARHPRLRDLGPEPLEAEFSGEHLYRSLRGRRAAVKALIMDSHIVVGVGNIYASEALFRAGIRPGRAGGRVSRPRCERLAEAVRTTLADAIRVGGTTLRDYLDPQGTPGYFALTLSVYGRAGEPCRTCGTPIRHQVTGQRSSYYCPRCQS